MEIKEGLKYSAEHEWVKVDGNVAIIGITDFAQSELGEIVYVEVETVGETIAKDEIFGTIEAVKTTSDLYMPLSGKILEFNKKLDENEGDQPDLVNNDAYGEGWIIKVEMSDASELDQLMDHTGYNSHIS